MSDEAWRDIKDTSYRVSSEGRVYSRFSDKCLSLNHKKTGYLHVLLKVDKVRSNNSVHRLVAQAFILNPLNLPCVNHINGNKHDNKVENLEWITWANNMKHGYATGLINNTGVNNGRSKLTEADVKRIRGDKSLSPTKLAKELGVAVSTIHRVKSGNTWKTK